MNDFWFLAGLGVAFVGWGLMRGKLSSARPWKL